MVGTYTDTFFLKEIFMLLLAGLLKVFFEGGNVS